MMHVHHPLSEDVRFRFWQETEPEGWWFYGDVSEGWGEWVVRAVGEDDLPAFAEFPTDWFPY
jgi:hypothetical protein